MGPNPMSPEIQVIVGMLLLSAGASYAWWVSLRVWMLRQDLFTIRGELWDAMCEAGTLDDPDHRALRNSLNALIQLAPSLSVLTFLRILVEGAHAPRPIRDQPVSFEIRAFQQRAGDRLVRYLTRETLLGVAFLWSAIGFCLLILTPARVVRQRFAGLVDQVFRSVELASLGRLAELGPGIGAAP